LRNDLINVHDDVYFNMCTLDTDLFC